MAAVRRYYGAFISVRYFMSQSAAPEPATPKAPSLLRSGMVVSVMTLLSRVLGMVRDKGGQCIACVNIRDPGGGLGLTGLA